MLTVTGKVKRTRPVMVEDFRFLKAATKRTAKVCLPSPTWLHMRGGRKTVSESAYPDIEEFWRDIVQAFHEEIRDLADRRAAPICSSTRSASRSSATQRSASALAQTGSTPTR